MFAGGPLAASTVMATDGPYADRAATAAPAADPEAWRFSATGYAWLLNVSGNLMARGQRADVNASFPQLAQASDSLGALMGYFEAGKGRVGIYADVVWARLEFSRSMSAYRNPMPGLTLGVAANAGLTYSMTIVELGGVYEVARWAGRPGSFTAIDGLLGFRYWNNAVDLNLGAIGTVNFAPLGFELSRGIAIAHSGTLQWIDPLLGVRLRHQFTPSQQIFVRGDLGGFGLQSQFTWQAVAAYSYSWQLNGYQLAGAIGYRALAVDYVNGAGIGDNGVNVVLHGPIIGLTVRF